MYGYSSSGIRVFILFTLRLSGIEILASNWYKLYLQWNICFTRQNKKSTSNGFLVYAEAFRFFFCYIKKKSFFP